MNSVTLWRVANFNESLPQCDQMAILIFLYLPICNNENVPNSKEYFPKMVQHFAIY